MEKRENGNGASLVLRDWRIESGGGGVPESMAGEGTIQMDQEGDCVVVECQTPTGDMVTVVFEFDAGHLRLRIHPPSEQDAAQAGDEAVVNLVAVKGGVMVGNGYARHALLYRSDNRVERTACFRGDAFILEERKHQSLRLEETGA